MGQLHRLPTLGIAWLLSACYCPVQRGNRVNRFAAHTLSGAPSALTVAVKALRGT